MESIKRLSDLNIEYIDSNYDLDDINGIIRFTEDFIHIMTDIEIMEWTNIIGGKFTKGEINFTDWLRFLRATTVM